MNGPTTVGRQEYSSSAVRFLTTLSPFYKRCSEVVFPVSISGAMWNVTGLPVLNFYSFACLWNLLASLHEDHALVINILTTQHALFLKVYPPPFLPLPSCWLIHTLLWIVAEQNQNKTGGVPVSEDKAFSVFTWRKWWNMIWAELLVRV